MGDMANEALEAGLAAYWSNQSRCVGCKRDCYSSCPYPREIFDDYPDINDYEDY